MVRTVVIWVAGLLSLVGIAVGIYDSLKRPGDVSNPKAAFEAPKQGPKKKPPKRFDWPMYGYDLARTKSLGAASIRPPLRKRWSWDSKQLIEFSPIVVGKRIYGMNNDALFYSLEADTGKVRWKKQVAQLTASSPAFHKGTLYAVTLEPGQLLALRASDGKVLWRRSLPGRVESSPAVYKGKVIFGCECNSVFAFDAKNGKQLWRAPTAGSVKAAPAIKDGKAYVGDYAGDMYAINTVNGGIVWRASDQGGSFGRAGRFYSTPAVAFGRVYAGNVDGRIYSYATRDGALAWTHSTGDWVYSGIVVSRVENRPAVFTGSFDHRAYALDAQSGELLWSKDVDGIVSGSGSVVGDIFYVSTLAGKTYGLDADTGKKVFEFDKGEYNPVITDGRRIYLTGYSSINALDPVRKKQSKGKGTKKQKGGKGKQ